MKTDTAASVTTFVVAGFTAHVSIPKGSGSNVHVEWTPRVPNMNVDFDSDQVKQYRLHLMEAIVEAKAHSFRVIQTREKGQPVES